jgi:hypothetical protein
MQRHKGGVKGQRGAVVLMLRVARKRLPRRTLNPQVAGKVRKVTSDQTTKVERKQLLRQIARPSKDGGKGQRVTATRITPVERK